MTGTQAVSKALQSVGAGGANGGVVLQLSNAHLTVELSLTLALVTIGISGYQLTASAQ